jgi:hypothetical protein
LDESGTAALVDAVARSGDNGVETGEEEGAGGASNSNEDCDEFPSSKDTFLAVIVV